MLTHKKDKPNPLKNKILDSGHQRFSWDGINSLRYRVVRREEGQLFTRIVVDINEKEVMSLDAKSALQQTSDGWLRTNDDGDIDGGHTMALEVSLADDGD